jgi:hypothetical protein
MVPRSPAPSLFIVLATACLLATVAHSQNTDEQAITGVIESVDRAINQADLTLLLDQFADDAVIDSRIARAKVSKQEYGVAMAAAFRAHQIIGMETRDIRITMVDPTHATVLATIYPMMLAQRLAYDHEWKFEKRDGRWLIVQTIYRQKVQEPVEGLIV